MRIIIIAMLCLVLSGCSDGSTHLINAVCRELKYDGAVRMSNCKNTKSLSCIPEYKCYTAETGTRDYPIY